MSRFTLLIVDDHEVARDGIRYLVERNFPELSIVGEAATAVEAIATFKEKVPDFVIVDRQLVGNRLSGLEVVQFVRDSQVLASAPIPTCVIMLTADLDESFKIKAVEAGVDYYVTKNTGTKELKQILRGEMEKRSSYVTYNHPVNNAPTPVTSEDFLTTRWELLTERESQIATILTTTNLTTKAIAAYIGTSERTVQNHIYAIYRKLDISSRTELILLNRILPS